MAIQPIQVGEPARQAQPAENTTEQKSVIAKAFENIQSFFSRIGTANLVGATVIVLSFYFFGAFHSALTALAFVVYKIGAGCLSPPKEREAPQIPEAPRIIRVPQVIQAPPVHRLPPGSIRSQYFHRSIHDHQYQAGHEEAPAELQEALQNPLPNIYVGCAHHSNCCAITSTIVDYFHRYGFQNLTPYKLDALLARGIQIDAAVRAQGQLGTRPIEIYDFFLNLPIGQLTHLHFNPGSLPVQAFLSESREENKATFQGWLTQLERSSPNQSVCGIFLAAGHFTGVYIERNQEGGIQNIYFSESRQRFPNGLIYDAGGAQGASVASLGNTIDGASELLAEYFNGINMVTMFSVERR